MLGIRPKINPSAENQHQQLSGESSISTDPESNDMSEDSLQQLPDFGAKQQTRKHTSFRKRLSFRKKDESPVLRRRSKSQMGAIADGGERRRSSGGAMPAKFIR